jgi:hypothetical protein
VAFELGSSIGALAGIGGPLGGAPLTPSGCKRAFAAVREGRFGQLTKLGTAPARMEIGRLSVTLESAFVDGMRSTLLTAVRVLLAGVAVAQLIGASARQRQGAIAPQETHANLAADEGRGPH